MESKLFKITLKSDIILNSSLATVGNLESLDFIPGSNILGVVAQHYNQFEDHQYEVFHSGKVKFGNAYKTDGDLMSFPMPFDVLRPKGSNDFSIVKLHHATDHGDPENKSLQLKQERGGYISLNGKIITPIVWRNWEKYLKRVSSAMSKQDSNANTNNRANGPGPCLKN